MSDISDIDAKLEFLQGAEAYGDKQQSPECIETHMSWVFLVGDQVFKLKKSVRFSYLDFTTLKAREFYCREELRLNARLAPGVYLGLMALVKCSGRFALLPESDLTIDVEIIDWLVLMRRLPASRMLHRLISDSCIRHQDIDALVNVLCRFYQEANQVHLSSNEFSMRYHRSIRLISDVLLLPQFQLPLPDAAIAIDKLGTIFTQAVALLQYRASHQRVLEGHGDLRPEHVCLMPSPLVIDCIEFDPQLREVDPFDEISFLSLECEMAGASWIGPYFISACMDTLNDRPPQALLHFYTAHKAMLRARFSIAHLLDTHPRAPEKWPILAQRYVARALVAMDDFNAATLRDLT